MILCSISLFCLKYHIIIIAEYLLLIYLSILYDNRQAAATQITGVLLPPRSRAFRFSKKWGCGEAKQQRQGPRQSSCLNPATARSLELWVSVGSLLTGSFKSFRAISANSSNSTVPLPSRSTEIMKLSSWCSRARKRERMCEGRSQHRKVFQTEEGTATGTDSSRQKEVLHFACWVCSAACLHACMCAKHMYMSPIYRSYLRFVQGLSQLFKRGTNFLPRQRSASWSKKNICTLKFAPGPQMRKESAHFSKIAPNNVSVQMEHTQVTYTR